MGYQTYLLIPAHLRECMIMYNKSSIANGYLIFYFLPRWLREDIAEKMEVMREQTLYLWRKITCIHLQEQCKYLEWITESRLWGDCFLLLLHHESGSKGDRLVSEWSTIFQAICLYPIAESFKKNNIWKSIIFQMLKKSNFELSSQQ